MVRTEFLSQFDYQLDRHCSKTPGRRPPRGPGFDYQLDRHCSKTHVDERHIYREFDYQLDRHCSKTGVPHLGRDEGLITS